MKQQSAMTLYILTLTLTLFLAACGAAPGGNVPNTVQVTETDFHITSSVTSFSHSVTYHFVVKNNGNTAHEFMIMPRSEGSMNGMSMRQMDQMALVSIDNINPGETKTFNYTFPSSAANPQPQFACYLPGHYDAGMKEDVMVK